MSLSQRFALAEAASKNSGGSPVNPYLEKIRREIAILKKCAHPNIVTLREFIDDPRAKKIYLVLEYLEGGDISWQRELEDGAFEPVISIEQARYVFRDLISGISYRTFLFVLLSVFILYKNKY
jgi:serine/threonine protein kinase